MTSIDMFRLMIVAGSLQFDTETGVVRNASGFVLTSAQVDTIVYDELAKLNESAGEMEG